jgi:hypothetical protein
LSALNGKPLNGVWRLRLSDQYNNDFGTLLCWGLNIVSHEATVTCAVFNPPPTATNLSLATSMNTTATAMLSAGDIDGDPITFQVVAPPLHGELISFDPNTGAFSYRPHSNFVGNDTFTFLANDGQTNSPAAAVTLALNATGPVFTGYEHFSDGRFVLHVVAPPGPAYAIESSTNLIQWLPITTNTMPASPYDFVGGEAGDYPQRFFRVRQ